MSFLDLQYSELIHNINSMSGVYKCKKDAFLLGIVALSMKKGTSTHAAPC
jgi:hypothetical protein